MILVKHINPLPSPFIHPYTGVAHTRQEDGSWLPPMDSQPSPVFTRWMTQRVPVPREKPERDEFLSVMPSIAKGLSEITGHTIAWHWMPDACDPWGDYGFFKVSQNSHY